MRYYTVYNLEIIPESSTIIAELRAPGSSSEYAFDENGKCEEAVKGYDLRNEIKTVAEKYPNHIFILSGDGEENTDMWKCYFKGDSEEVIKAILTFADPSNIFEPNEGQRRSALEDDYKAIKTLQQEIMDNGAKEKQARIESLKAQLRALEK